MTDTKIAESNETGADDLEASKEKLLVSSPCFEPCNPTQRDMVDAANPSVSAGENDDDHHFDVRFIRRPRLRANVIRDIHNKKQEPEVAIVKPHDLTVVHDLLLALISREQQFQQKPLVSWESVQRRYNSMVCDKSSLDRDLFFRYQPDLGFFPESMDEKLLDVWTGKKSLLDVFSLPEFSDIGCVREPLPPYGLLVLVDQSQRFPQSTSSIAIGTEENEEPSSLKLPRRSKKSKRVRVSDEEPAVSVAPLLRHSPHRSLDDILVADKQAILTSSADPKSEDVAPEAVALPNPLAFFKNSANSSSLIESTTDSQITKAVNRDGTCVTTLGSDAVASSCLMKTGTLGLQDTAESSFFGHYENRSSTSPITTDSRLSELHILKWAAEEVPPVTTPVKVKDALLEYRRDVCSPDKLVSSTLQRNNFVNSFTSSLSNSSSETAADDAISSSPNSFSSLLAQKKNSVLDGLVFPETNAEVRRCLEAIQEAAAVCVADTGALLKMEAVLSELDESVTSEWIDYVFMYLPQIQVLPCDGQIFLAWKEK